MLKKIKVKKAGGKYYPKGVCRICKCTETEPCIGSFKIPGGGTANTCSWTDKTQTLCTGCVAEAAAKDAPVEKAKAKK
jgi:hypothetical protein